MHHPFFTNTAACLPFLVVLATALVPACTAQTQSSGTSTSTAGPAVSSTRTSTSAAAAAAATNTNLQLNFTPIPTVYSCASVKIAWTLPADLTSATSAQIVDLYVSNEDLDQSIPPASSTTASTNSPSSLVGSTSSTTSAATKSTASTVGQSTTSASIRTTTAAVALSTASAVTRTTSAPVSSNSVQGRGLIPRSVPSGSTIINRKITLINAASRQYTFIPLTLPAGRYIVYATPQNNNATHVGTSAVFSVLAGANQTCLDTTSAADTTNSSSSGVSTATIVGAVIGCILGTLIIAFIAFWFWRRKQRKSIWLSSSSRRLFSTEDDSRKGFLGLGLRRKRDSQRSTTAHLNKENMSISSPVNPGGATSSGWKTSRSMSSGALRDGLGQVPYTGVGFANESQADFKEKEYGVDGVGHDKGGIELAKIPSSNALDQGVGLNIPSLGNNSVTHRQPEYPIPAYLAESDLGHNKTASTSSSSTSPTHTSPDKISWDYHGAPLSPDQSLDHLNQAVPSPSIGQSLPRGQGLERNVSSGSTTLGRGGATGLVRNVSSKRKSVGGGGGGGSGKRKPVPILESHQTDVQGMNEFGRFNGSREEVLADRNGSEERAGNWSNRDSQLSLLTVGGSDNGAAGSMKRPGDISSGRNSFILIPDKPLDQDEQGIREV